MIRARKEGLRAKAPAPIKMPLFNLTVNRDADSRVDKYRANVFSPTSLYHANIQDAGDHPIPVIAKVRLILNGISQIFLSCKMRTFERLGLQITVYTMQYIILRFVRLPFCFQICHDDAIKISTLS